MTSNGIPQGYDEIVSAYGDPKPFVKEDGRVHASWERTIIKYASLPSSLKLGWGEDQVSRIGVHRDLVPSVNQIFQEIYDAGFWPLLKTYDGCYCWRPQRGDSGKLSTHCWGIAIDLNAASNPLGGPGDMPPSIIEAFVKRGWAWGGNFPRPDPMHFQAVQGY